MTGREKQKQKNFKPKKTEKRVFYGQNFEVIPKECRYFPSIACSFVLSYQCTLQPKNMTEMLAFKFQRLENKLLAESDNYAITVEMNKEKGKKRERKDSRTGIASYGREKGQDGKVH
jgi:hypothetical protein